MAGARQPEQTRVLLPRTFRAFENSSYRLLWPSNLSTNISRFMQMTLLMWLVLELKHSPWLVALVGFFGMAPMLLLGLMGGIMADRVNRQRLLMLTAGFGTLVSVAMIVLLASEAVRFWHAYVVILMNGVGFALDMPSRRSLIHDLLGRSGATNGFALDSVAMSASRMIGPALAGGLIVLGGVLGGYVAVTVLYFASFVMLWRLGGRDTGRRSAGPRGSVLTNLAQGLRYVSRQRILMATVMITLVMNVLLFPYMNMVPVIAQDVLRVGPGLMGLLQAFDGLGALIGGVAIASAAVIRYHGRLFIAGSLLAMGALLLFSFSSLYLLSLPAVLALGLGTAGFSTMQSTIVLLVSREEARGTALGVMSLAIGSAPFGALLVGWVAELNGPESALKLSAVVGIVLVSLIAVAMPALRQPIAGSD